MHIKIVWSQSWKKNDSCVLFVWHVKINGPCASKLKWCVAVTHLKIRLLSAQAVWICGLRKNDRTNEMRLCNDVKKPKMHRVADNVAMDNCCALMCWMSHQMKWIAFSSKSFGMFVHVCGCLNRVEGLEWDREEVNVDVDVDAVSA